MRRRLITLPLLVVMLSGCGFTITLTAPTEPDDGAAGPALSSRRSNRPNSPCSRNRPATRYTVLRATLKFLAVSVGDRPSSRFTMIR